jgi:predicted RNA binding protein YcfA (HicA-like mRNA interferase family)
MPKAPVISAQEAIRAFQRAGFLKDRQSGSHCILKKAGHPIHLSIPDHKGKKLGQGLLKAQIEAAGLTIDEFKSLL